MESQSKPQDSDVDEFKIAEIITQTVPNYKPSSVLRLRQWLFGFCSCFQSRDTELEHLCQTEEFYLPPQQTEKKTLVLDLDETLVHSVFTDEGGADVVLPIELGGKTIMIYVRVRPNVQEFLTRASELYEVVIYTASLSKYADPLLDKLDHYSRISARLFRENCVLHLGAYTKDLAKLGRDMRNVLIIDNSPASYAFNPENAIPISSWYEDPADRELLRLIPALEELAKVEDVRECIAAALSNLKTTSTTEKDAPPSEELEGASTADFLADRSFSLPKRRQRRRSLDLLRGDFNSPVHREGKTFDFSGNAKL